jgi:UDP-glucose 6-dehydrogenase
MSFTPLPHPSDPIAVLGTRAGGLAAALDLVRAGHHVVVWDDDPEAIGALRDGESPFMSPADGATWRLAIGCGLLTFTTYMADAVAASRAILLALPPYHAMPLIELYGLIGTSDHRVVQRVPAPTP